MPVSVKGFLRCETAEQAARLRDALPEHKRLTLEEPGCVSFVVSETADPLVWQVDEVFADRAAFDAHVVRLRAADWSRDSEGVIRDFEVKDTP